MATRSTFHASEVGMRSQWMFLLPKGIRFLKNSGLMMLSVLFLSACGGDQSPAAAKVSEHKATPTAQAEPVDSADNKGETAYKAKVDKEVNESVVNSLVREWGISEKQARCLLGDLRASQLGRAGSDPAVQAVFEKCRVDPSVAAEANKWIAYYQKYMPSVDDIFLRLLNEGDAFKVDCWIQENTTVRAAKK